MAFDAKYLTREELDLYYSQAEAHLEPQFLELHLRRVILGGPEKLSAEDQERLMELRHAQERLLLDWEQSRLVIDARERDSDASPGN